MYLLNIHSVSVSFTQASTLMCKYLPGGADASGDREDNSKQSVALWHASYCLSCARLKLHVSVCATHSVPQDSGQVLTHLSLDRGDA